MAIEWTPFILEKTREAELEDALRNLIDRMLATNNQAPVANVFGYEEFNSAVELLHGNGK